MSDSIRVGLRRVVVVRRRGGAVSSLPSCVCVCSFAGVRAHRHRHTATEVHAPARTARTHHAHGNRIQPGAGVGQRLVTVRHWLRTVLTRLCASLFALPRVCVRVCVRAPLLHLPTLRSRAKQCGGLAVHPKQIVCKSSRVRCQTSRAGHLLRYGRLVRSETGDCHHTAARAWRACVSSRGNTHASVQNTHKTQARSPNVSVSVCFND